MKYKINRNQTPLTDADLSAAQNFQQVMKGYRNFKVPFYRTGRFYTAGSAMIVAAAVTLVVLFGDPDSEQKAYIAPPIAQIDIAQDGFTVDADSATVIDYKSGSKITIPAGAFRGADGQAVSGKVNLKYREFHDQKDIFLSGIPMTYDSAGQTFVFESAGMMEITAYQDGKALTADPAKPIKVDMVSNTAEDSYNTYFLDTVARKWINLNVSNMAPQQENDAEKRLREKPSLVAGLTTFSQSSPAMPFDPIVAKVQQELKKATAAVAAVEKEKPMPIAKADKAKTKFHIVVDKSEFPEISMYQNVRFQVKDELNFDKTSAKTEWEDVKLKKLTGIDYQVEFSKGSKKMAVVATPVIDDKDLPAAQKVYDTKYAEYEKKLTDRKAAEEKAKLEYEARVKDMNERMEKAIAEDKEREHVYQATLNKTQLVYRTFSVYRFGTYNCDSPIGWPSEANVVASLVSESGEKLNLTCLNLVEKSRNAVFPYASTKGECKAFKFNPSKENMLWAVTDDNKLAVVDISSFKAQQNRSGSVQFKMKVIDQDFKSADEVKKYLEI